MSNEASDEAVGPNRGMGFKRGNRQPTSYPPYYLGFNPPVSDPAR